jgi:hypothetical protein
MNAELLDQSGTYLRLFGSKITVDKTLPKYDGVEVKEKVDLSHINNMEWFSTTGESDPDLFMFVPNVTEGSIGEKSSKFNFDWIRKFFKTEEKFEMSILDFFSQVKLSSKKAQADYVNRVEEYAELLVSANDMGQTALCDKIKEKINLYKYESILHAEGRLYKITEEQIVEFAKKTERGLRLDYIKNFTRVIPSDVQKEKKKADKLKVFDNYVILHYDPLKKNVAPTAKEKEADRKKKADPILFGVIAESHDLYYITDWVDDTCDLTLDEFVKVMGIKKEELEIGKPKV